MAHLGHDVLVHRVPAQERPSMVIAEFRFHPERPGTFLTWRALTRYTSIPYCSRTWDTGTR